MHNIWSYFNISGFLEGTEIAKCLGAMFGEVEQCMQVTNICKGFKKEGEYKKNQL